MTLTAILVGDDSRLEVIRDGLSREEYREIRDGMSAAEKKRMRDQLSAKRDLETHGIRKTNKSLAMDALQTANGIGDTVSGLMRRFCIMIAYNDLQLIDLFERTGVRAFAMFTRSNAEDTAVPHIVDSDDARAFFQQVFGKSFLEFLLKFEQWSCTLDKGAFPRDFLCAED